MESNKNEAFQQKQENFPPLREWSEEFNCYIVNGILAPIPISVLVEKEEHEPESSSQSAASRKKKRTKEGDEEFFFRLFKFPKAQGEGAAAADEEYVLEMHDPKTCGIYRYRLVAHEIDGNWKISTSDLEAGDHVVVPVVEDPSPPKFPPKYTLSLPERLIGWTVERRKRSNGKEDKFYYHGGRQFRSFIEVTAFILYSTKPKDLNTMTTATTQQPQESNMTSKFLEYNI